MKLQGASLGLVTKEVFEIRCCCWSLWMLYNSMLIDHHWKTKRPVELEHIFQDSGMIKSVEDSHHFSVQIKYVHQYTSMTYKMKNTYRYEVALLLLHVACCTYMVQPEKCYTTQYFMCRRKPLCSAGPVSETMHYR